MSGSVKEPAQPVPEWASKGIATWPEMMAVVAKVERTPEAIARFQAEALRATEAGLAPLPPPLTAHQAEPDDARIRTTSVDRWLPPDWRFVNAPEVLDQMVAGGRFVDHEDAFDRRPIPLELMRAALGREFRGPYLLAHYAPDGKPAGVYLSVSARKGCMYVVVPEWGATAKRFDKHYHWSAGGLSEKHKMMPDERLAGIDGRANAVASAAADAIRLALQRALQEEKP